MLERVCRAGERIREQKQCEVFTEHVIHAGMYSRTITMPPGRILEGVFVKVPTLVITVGNGAVLAGERFEPVRGYQVRPASAKRKQLFISEGPLIITMIFPTRAKTVAEAEAEFTDDCELLLSRHQDANSVVITGE